MSDWTCDSNEAFYLSLVRAKADKTVLAGNAACEGFHPPFTYPIYGEKEKIYGYRNLKIDLKLASGSLIPYLNVSFLQKLDSSSTVDEPEKILSEYIPSDYLTNEIEFLKRVEEDADTFKPSGQMIYSYSRPSEAGNGKNISRNIIMDAESEDIIIYEVYHATWDTPGFRDYHRRMQLFILLYIEGGSYIDESEDIWQFFVLYERRKRKDAPHLATYHFLGYSSLYPFYFFPEMVRMRLSQFVILTPYQRAGHGSELYKAIYQYVLHQQNMAELTVEDPAEAFEDLRDKNDLKMLLNHDKFMEEAFGSDAVSHGGGRVRPVRGTTRIVKEKTGDKIRGMVGPPSDKSWVEKWRKDLKIASRQFQRLIEMLLLWRLDSSDQRAVRAYRLQVKERLYRFNFEILAQLDRNEKYEKLEETFQSVQEGYRRILTLIQ